MICHVDAVVSVYNNKYTDEYESKYVFLITAIPKDIADHRQGKHHAGNSHIATWPALEVIIAASQIRHHLPPVSVFA